MEVTVVNERENNRFAAYVNEHVAKLEYSLENNQLILKHTGVPKELGGQGIAGQLVEAAVDWAQAENFVVAPWCSYTSHWLQKHPYEAGRVKVDWTEPPEDPDQDHQ